MSAAELTALGEAPGLDVEIVVPVYNEELAVVRSVRRLHRYLQGSFPFTWRILIVDNASTDGTLAVAERLSRELPHVDAMHLRTKGRGRALRAAWIGSPAQVVCYMDVDLSTDLRALLPLVAPLLSGHSDLAIGSRLAHGARVTRGPKRELISRAYNRLLHAALRTRFTDAQCGFKALRADTARELLADVTNEEWFFDTELLVQAQRKGLRIHEVPVDWVEDRDSRVEIVPTALEDLRGVVRLVAQSTIARFMAVGVASTVAYALLYLLLRMGLGPQPANLIALAITGVANTAANRRFTFRIRGRAGLARQHAAGLLVFVITAGLTGAALALLDKLVDRPPRLLELVVLVTASAAATLTRFVALRTWVFARCGTAGAKTPLTSPGPG
jgi:glycosyltransferase involved in cell wall biosynthesis